MDIEEMLAKRPADEANVVQRKLRMEQAVARHAQAQGEIAADIWLAEGMAPSVIERLSAEDVRDLVQAARIPDEQLDFDNVVGLGQSEEAPPRN